MRFPYANARVSEGNLQSAKEGARGNVVPSVCFLWILSFHKERKYHKKPKLSRDPDTLRQQGAVGGKMI